jgi:hypothetical protein
LLHDTACKIPTKFIINVNIIQQLFQRFPEAPYCVSFAFNYSTLSIETPTKSSYGPV